MKHSLVMKMCESCKRGYMFSLGQAPNEVETQDGMKRPYLHRCVKCGATAAYFDSYPGTVLTVDEERVDAESRVFMSIEEMNALHPNLQIDQMIEYALSSMPGGSDAGGSDSGEKEE